MDGRRRNLFHHIIHSCKNPSLCFGSFYTKNTNPLPHAARRTPHTAHNKPRRSGAGTQVNTEAKQRTRTRKTGTQTTRNMGVGKLQQGALMEGKYYCFSI